MSHILLAEDDNSMRQFLELALARAGHKITSCTNGLEALKLIQEQGQDFDMLLADIVMPGMDGIELSQKAATLAPAMKIMFITGFAAVAMGQRNSANAGAGHARILSKPFHLNDLVKQVEELLASEPKTEV